MRVSETRASADSASGAQKSPGALRRNPGFGRTQRVPALRSFLRLDCGRNPIAALEGERGRASAQIRCRLAAYRHVQSCPHQFTRHRSRSSANKKARNARAVRATDRSRAALLERRSRIRGGLAAALQRSGPQFVQWCRCSHVASTVMGADCAVGELDCQSHGSGRG